MLKLARLSEARSGSLRRWTIIAGSLDEETPQRFGNELEIRLGNTIAHFDLAWVFGGHTVSSLNPQNCSAQQSASPQVVQRAISIGERVGRN